MWVGSGNETRRKAGQGRVYISTRKPDCLLKMATAQLALELELKRSSDGSMMQKTLPFARFPESVADLKQRIEDEYSIPKSDQSLRLPGGHALLDAERIADLYMRSGDTVHVTFFSEADVKQLREANERSLRPTLEILRSNTSLKDAKSMQKNRDTLAVLTSSQSSLHDIGFKSLLPWNDARTEANRRFIIQTGMLDTVLEIYSILLPFSWNLRGHWLQNLEICCLTFLWNFSETEYARQLIVVRGGLNMMISSLMHQSNKEFLKLYTMHDIFDVATGCLSK